MSLRNYVVPDLVRDEVEFLFILESPHIDEVRHKLPLSGSAGITVTEALKVSLGLPDDSSPFGLLISQGLVSNKVGIVNACSIPLQKDAYKQCNIPDAIVPNLMNDSMFKKMESIRENPKLRKRKTRFATREEMNRLISRLHHHFKRRIIALNLAETVTIVLCGGFAKQVWEECFPDDTKMKICVPHPSMGGWVDPNKVDKIVALKEALNSNQK
ncbi:hypothetical protein AB0533_004468 [Vibrio parahaemolyticus]|uniref:hypothetical protein n=1 Tax=Vibrio parahaemolyticus TaxID=670 RepID=UPI001E62AB34|nr:hypothetical protein [Vibrio parahaemolyticus]ELB2044414.1 hypothetical protein [Vibrio parahaemolyticus]